MNITAPLNPTSYGHVSINLINSLVKLGHPVAVNPIQDIITDDYLQYNSSLNIARKAIDKYDSLAPSLQIWHSDNLSRFVGRGPSYAMPIFELNKFTSTQLHHLNNIDNIIVNSQWAKQVCIENNIAEQKVHVCPLGVSPQFAYDISSIVVDGIEINLKDKFNILNIGKWEIRKGHDVITTIINSAFKQSEYNDIRLIMLPQNDYLDEEDSRGWRDFIVKSSNVDVVILDRLPAADLWALMNACQVGLFPTRAEGWCLPAMDMLSLGKHIVITNYSGQTEYISVHNAHLVDPLGLESAIDGKWFFGEGEWATLDLVKFAKQLRIVYLLGDSVNTNGIETSEQFSWDNSARRLWEIMNG